MSDRLPEGASLLEKYKVGEAARAEAQSSESYEVLYNYGTMLIYSDRLEEAREVLQRALRCGRLELRDGEELAVDAEEESGEEPELDPIRVQLAFIAARRGAREEAERLLQAVLSHSGNSRILSTIATSNLVALHGGAEVAEGLKKWRWWRALRRRLRSIPADVFEKLTRAQQEAIRFNRAVLLLLLNRVGAAAGREA